MNWPTCPAVVHFHGIDPPLSFSCDRPQGHEMDGEPMHRDPEEGVEWGVGVFDTELAPRKIKDNPQA